MKKITALLFLLFSIFVSSCNEVYKSYEENMFDGFIWKSGDAATFKPEIKDAAKPYKLTIGLRHVYALQRKNLEVNVKSISPSGKEQNKVYNLEIKNKANESNSSCAGDICDLDVVVEDNYKFEEAGQYQFIISHTEKGNNIPGIMEIGLVIENVE